MASIISTFWRGVGGVYAAKCVSLRKFQQRHDDVIHERC